MPSVPRIDLVGQRFGRLVVLKEEPRPVSIKKLQRRFRCLCDCGNEKVICYGNLRTGIAKSCGCLHLETVSIHGHASAETQTPEYRAWADMHNRCKNPNIRNYARYGGRGITVCERWDNFETFLADLGKRPSKMHSLERIDNDAGYSPDNCRWATKKDQCNNTSRSCFLEYDGLRLTITQWAERLGVSRNTLHGRRRKGWTDREIIEDRPHLKTGPKPKPKQN